MRTARYPVNADTPRETAHTLDVFMGRFALNTEDMADFLRSPGDAYPTPGLIRTMLHGKQMPSERFLHLLATRLAEVEAQLETGIAALSIEDRVKRVFRVEPKKHITTMLYASDLELSHRDTDDVVEAMRAVESVPESWVHRCAICNRVFVARSSRQRICRRTDANGRFPCIREHHRLQRQAKKAAGLAALAALNCA